MLKLRCCMPPAAVAAEAEAAGAEAARRTDDASSSAAAAAAAATTTTSSTATASSPDGANTTAAAQRAPPSAGKQQGTEQKEEPVVTATPAAEPQAEAIVIAEPLRRAAEAHDKQRKRNRGQRNQTNKKSNNKKKKKKDRIRQSKNGSFLAHSSSSSDDDDDDDDDSSPTSTTATTTTTTTTNKATNQHPRRSRSRSRPDDDRAAAADTTDKHNRPRSSTSPGPSISLQRITTLEADNENLPPLKGVLTNTPFARIKHPRVDANTIALAKGSWDAISQGKTAPFDRYKQRRQRKQAARNGTGTGGGASTTTATIAPAEFFFDTFYKRLFVEEAPEARRYFRVRGKSRMKAQSDALFKMMNVSLTLLDKGAELRSALLTLAKRHNDRAIRARHYVSVGRVLLYSLKRCLGNTLATPAVMDAWTNIYSYMLRVMMPSVMEAEAVRTLKAVEDVSSQREISRSHRGSKSLRKGSGGSDIASGGGSGRRSHLYRAKSTGNAAPSGGHLVLGSGGGNSKGSKNSNSGGTSSRAASRRGSYSSFFLFSKDRESRGREVLAGSSHIRSRRSLSGTFSSGGAGSRRASGHHTPEALKGGDTPESADGGVTDGGRGGAGKRRSRRRSSAPNIQAFARKLQTPGFAAALEQDEIVIEEGDERAAAEAEARAEKEEAEAEAAAAATQKRESGGEDGGGDDAATGEKGDA